LFIPFLILAYAFSKGGNSKTRASKQVLLALLGFFLIAAPYWIALRVYSGRWVVDGRFGGYTSQILYSTDIDQEIIFERYSGELTPDGSDFLINNGLAHPRPEWATPGRVLANYIHRYSQKLLRVYQDYPFTPTYPDNVYLLYLLPAILLGLGLFTESGRWKDRPSDRFVLYWLIPFIFATPLIFVEVRYYIPLIPILVPFMAIGAVYLAWWFNNRSTSPSDARQNRYLVWVIAIFIILALPKITYKITHWNDPSVSYNPRKVAAEWIIQNTGHPARIMEYAHSVSFYSGAQSILIPKGNVENVIRIAHRYDVHYLSLDEYYLHMGDRRPELDYLMDSHRNPPEGLKLLYFDERYPGLHHYIYEIE
jgi:hypothetical protein